MKLLTDKSKELIKLALKENNIYHISSLPTDVLINEVCPHTREPNIHSLRYNYLLNNTGLVSQLNNYYSYTRRLFEYFANGNFANTLRQRLNICQTLIECNGKTAVPVHISIGKNSDVGTKVDLDNFDSANFFTVTHPGYTRAAGSVFLNINLKNVLLYIRKDSGIEVEDKSYITKIEQPEDLLPYYNSLTGKEKEETFYLDFFMPDKGPRRDYRNNLKIHPPTDTSILKLNKFSSLGLIDRPEELHPMLSYVESTFESFNTLCECIFSNRLRIYTDNVKLVNISINQNIRKLIRTYFNNNDLVIRNLHSFIENHNHVPTYGGSAKHPTKTMLKDETGLYKKLFELKKIEDDEDKYLITGDMDIHHTDNLTDWKSIVIKNEYKGIAFVVQEDFIKFNDRDYHEMLYMIDTSKTISKTVDNGLVIINCNHSFWKTEKDFSENIIDKSIFKVYDTNCT